VKASGCGGPIAAVQEGDAALFVAHPDVNDVQGGLTAPQQAAVARIVEAMDGAGAHLLLAGATGSGKTEVYLQACAAALERGSESTVHFASRALAALFGAHPDAGLRPACQRLAQTWLKIERPETSRSSSLRGLRDGLP